MKILRLIKNILRAPGMLLQGQHRSHRMLKEILNVQDMQYRDLLDLQTGRKEIRYNTDIALKTDYPVAYETLDHLMPGGTLQDNTRSYAFYARCFKLFEKELSLLDLGCSGGGIVFDFALNGHVAIGLEGSDHSQRMGRANWRTIPENLFTCDITKDYLLHTKGNSGPYKFKVVSCWEVLEHIPEAQLAGLFSNVKKHLARDGVFIGSISKDPKDPLHSTVQDNEWWIRQFKMAGLRVNTDYSDAFAFGEFCRGIGGGLFDTNHFGKNPELGLHFVARLAE